MRTMKDSGVEWLGEVPDSWSISSLRRVARLKTGTTPEGAEYASEGDLAWVRPDDLVEEGGFILPTKFFSGIMAARSPVAQIGSTLICAIGTIGKASFVHQEVSFNQQITSVQPRGVEARFLFFLLSGARSEVESLSVGNVMHILNNSRFGALKVAVPSDLGEQHAIAGYLDQETSRIDSLISKKEQLIEKLLERRQALITQVVTKGLDPNVPMKDSRVEWLGEVPEDWEAKPMYAVGIKNGKKNKGFLEQNLLSLSYGRIIHKDINSEEGLLPESFDSYQIVEPGDLIFRFTDLQNDQTSLRSGLVRSRGIITSAYLGFRPVGINPEFLAYLMRAYDVNKAFYSMGSGLRQSLKWQDVRTMQIPVPSLELQKSFTHYLDQETSQIDTLVEKTRRAIELLKERRQALITQVVTGKIDVRGFAGGNS